MRKFVGFVAGLGVVLSALPVFAFVPVDANTQLTRTSKPSSGGTVTRFVGDDYQPPDVGGPAETRGAGTR